MLLTRRLHPQNSACRWLRPQQVSPQDVRTRPTTTHGFHTNNTRYEDARSGKRPTDRKQEELPKFSFEGLGASPAVKAVVYTAIGILGMVETYTYSIWIWHKLYPKPAEDGDEGEVDGGDR